MQLWDTNACLIIGHKYVCILAIIEQTITIESARNEDRVAIGGRFQISLTFQWLDRNFPWLHYLQRKTIPCHVCHCALCQCYAVEYICLYRITNVQWLYDECISAIEIFLDIVIIAYICYRYCTCSFPSGAMRFSATFPAPYRLQSLLRFRYQTMLRHHEGRWCSMFWQITIVEKMDCRSPEQWVQSNFLVSQYCLASFLRQTNIKISVDWDCIFLDGHPGPWAEDALSPVSCSMYPYL